MEISLKTRSLQYIAPVCVKEISTDHTFEMLLPDTLPDVGQVRTLNCTVLLRSKEPQQGRCKIACSAEISLTYSDNDQQELQALSNSYPFEISADDPQMSMDNMVVAGVECVWAESRSISSRKLLVRAVVLCKIKCFSQKEILISTGPDEDVYETRLITDNIRVITTVDEKRFELSNNFPLDGPAASELLSYKISLTPEDLSVSYDRLTAAGMLTLSAWYRPVDSAAPAYVEHCEPFKIDVPFISAGTAADCSGQLALTSVYVTNEPGLTGDGKTLGFDIGAVLQYSVVENVEVRYLADMYSTAQKVSCLSDRAVVCENYKPVECEVMLQEEMSMDDGVQQFLSASGAAGPVTAAAGEGGCFSCPVYISVVYRNSKGQICQHGGKFTATASMADCKAACVLAKTGDIVVVPTGGGCMVKINVVFCALCGLKKELNVITKATCEPQASGAPSPSLWITRYAPDKTMWDICKQHRVSEAYVRAANMLKADETPETGALLLIPKK